MGAQPVVPVSIPPLRGPTYEWALWSTTMRVVTDDPHALPSARRLIDGELAQVELAASRFRPDSEICTLPAGRRTRISPTLTLILAAVVRAARETGGAVDPTLGRALEAIGYDRDIDNLQEVRRGAGVNDPADLIAVPTGLAVATSSTVSCEWRADGREMHHIPDPLTGLPVSRDWRSATVVAPDCVTAHTWSTAALVEGTGATETLGELGYPARLVSADRTVRLLGGWPRDAELGPIAAGGL